MRAAFAPILGALAATPAFSLAASGQETGQDTQQDIANSTYECAAAIEHGLLAGQSYAVDVAYIWADFDQSVRDHGVSETVAAQWTRSEWQRLASPKTDAGLARYILGTARDCEDIYLELAKRRGAQPKEFSVSDFRYHMEKTGDPRPVFDYVVDCYREGSEGLGRIEQGEYLGELVLAIGAQGLLKLSDEVILALRTKRYWQANPKASGLVDREYQRRLKLRNYNSAEGLNWARRAQRDRLEQAEEKAKRLARSWGTSVRCTATQPRGLNGKNYTVCRPLDVFGR